MSLRQGAIASEQAINRLSGYRWEFPQNRGINREVGAIDRRLTRRQPAHSPKAYLEVKSPLADCG